MSVDHASDLARRIRAHVRSWPDRSIPELIRYVGSAGRRRGVARRFRGDRYWILLPQWLVASWRPEGGHAVNSRFLGDVLWGQYCLFLFVRIHDDLVDGQARDQRLLLVADDLLVESERTFARVTGRDFPALFNEHLRATLRSIAEVDRSQSKPGLMNRTRLSLYAGVSSIFKVGAAAVSEKCGRQRMFRHLAAFCDHLAIAMQVLDDIFDVEEDLARGRFNFAANLVLDRGRRTLSDGAYVARSVLVENNIGRLLAVVREQVDAATMAIEPACLPPATHYLARFRTQLERYQDAVHRARVTHLLPEACGLEAGRGGSGLDPLGELPQDRPSQRGRSR